jgi:hypothetical protein
MLPEVSATVASSDWYFDNHPCNKFPGSSHLSVSYGERCATMTACKMITVIIKWVAADSES